MVSYLCFEIPTYSNGVNDIRWKATQEGYIMKLNLLTEKSLESTAINGHCVKDTIYSN